MSDSVRVGDVLRLERREVAIEPATEYRLVGVYSFGKGIFHREPQPGAELGEYRFFRVEPGDLVLSNIQAWEGAIALATDADSGTIGTHRFLTYVPAEPRIDTAWARWFFLSEPGMTLIRQAAPGTAVRNRTLAVKRFEDLVIPLPPLDEQRQTARRISAITERGTRLVDAIRQRAAKAVALQASVAGGGVNGAAPDWPSVQLSEIVDARTADVVVEAAAKYRIAGVYSFGRGLIDRGIIEGADTSYRSLTRLATGDIVMSKLNGWEGAVTVVAPSFDGAHVSGEYPVFRPKRDLLEPGFFRGVTRSPGFWDQLNQSVRGSMVRRRRVNAKDFLDATIHLPDLATQTRISMWIDRLERVDALSVQAEERAAAIRAAVLNEEFAALA